MNRNLDEDELGNQLREALHADAGRTPLPPDFVAALARSVPDRAPSRRIWNVAAAASAIAVVLGTAVGLSIVTAPSTTPPPSGPTSFSPQPASPTSTPSGLRAFDGDGMTFDYPATWGFYPLQVSMSFSTTIGYLASTPVDTDAICQRSSSSLTCNFEGYDLPPGNVVIELAYAAWPISDPVEFYNRPAVGSRTTVGGMATVFSEEPAGTDRIRLRWQIARPDAFGNWIQIDADIRGPEMDALREQVDALIASFRFVPAPVPLPEGEAAAQAIAARALAAAVASEPAAYGCYPTELGISKPSVIEEVPTMRLKKPLPVTCSTSITRTDVGLWKLELVAAWDAAADREAGTLTTILWLLPNGSGGSLTGSGALPDAYCCR